MGYSLACKSKKKQHNITSISTAKTWQNISTRETVGKYNTRARRPRHRIPTATTWQTAEPHRQHIDGSRPRHPVATIPTTDPQPPTRLRWGVSGKKWYFLFLPFQGHPDRRSFIRTAADTRRTIANNTANTVFLFVFCHHKQHPTDRHSAR